MNLRTFAVIAALARPLAAHAPPTYIPTPPLHVESNAILDTAGKKFLLRGVRMPGLEPFLPTAADLDAVRAMTPFTFQILQQRWNMNAVRLPVSAPVWRRDGQPYLDRVAAIVKAANQTGLVVILAAHEDAASGASPDTGLPSAALPDFWRAWAAFFRDTPGVIFDLFNEPSLRSIPRASPAAHLPSDWQLWRNGGPLPNGQTAAGMQSLVDAIRSAGAQQIIAASSFQDPAAFLGFTPDAYLKDPNIVYETHPFLDSNATDTQRVANFGFLTGTFPVYAGSWGIPFGSPVPACTAIPSDVAAANDLLYSEFLFFDSRGINWTVNDFRPGSLLLNFTDYATTQFDRPGACDGSTNPIVGIGGDILFWMTGDPNGLGSISPPQIASAAGGPALPVAPGEIISIYAQAIGPEIPVGAALDSSGRLPTSLAGTQVFFDGVAVPMLLSSFFQVNVQVPYTAAGKTSSEVQIFYRGVPSNKILLPIIPAQPVIFPLSGTNSQAAAFNQDGSINSIDRPAPLGSIVAIFTTGTGVMTPPLVEGVPAPLNPPFPEPAQRVTVIVGDQNAELLFSGAAPTLIGVTQINLRLPPVKLDSSPQRVLVGLTQGSQNSATIMTLWLSQ